MARVISLILFILILFSLVTIILHKLFRRIRSIKYVPSIILFLLGIYNIYLSRTVTSEGFQALGKAIIAIMAFIGVFSGLVTGLIIDFGLNKKR